MYKKLLTITAALFFVAAIPGTAFAASHKGSNNGSHNKQSTSVGNDISYPQCNSTYPSGQAFGIVGVNDGLANTTNPCLASEFSWALASSGTSNQQVAQLYVNTANPEGLGVSDWPTNNEEPAGTIVSDPYGTCSASASASIGPACSWQYGYDRAYDDVQTRFTVTGASPSAYTWWLDVETANSWSSSTQDNTADLEGMVYYFNNVVGAKVGIYSTSSQWSQIVGTVSSSSSLYPLNDWVPGAKRLSAAQSNCSLPPFTNGKITLTQYTSRTTDYDNSCI